MPEVLIVLSGSSTEVGKTYVACALARSLRALGVEVAARKPAQSYARGSGPTDADLLAAATGEEREAVCPPHRSYELAMAPPMAAEHLGRPSFSVADLVDETHLPARGVMLVEGAGGPRSPLAGDGDTASLARELRADLVVAVCDAGLGVINAALLTASAFAPLPVVVFLNRYEGTDELHRANRAWLVERCALDVVTSVEDLLDRLIVEPSLETT